MMPSSRTHAIRTALRRPNPPATWIAVLVASVLLSSTAGATTLAEGIDPRSVELPPTPHQVINPFAIPGYGGPDPVQLGRLTLPLNGLMDEPAAFGVSSLYDASNVPDTNLQILIDWGLEQQRAGLFFRLESTAAFAGSELAGLDVIGLINLSDEAFSMASISGLGPTGLVPIMRALGLANPPGDGVGSEPVLVRLGDLDPSTDQSGIPIGLDPGQIFLALVPEGLSTGWGVEIDLDGQRFSASGAETGDVTAFVGVVPEPGTALLLGLGLAGLAHRGRPGRAGR